MKDVYLKTLFLENYRNFVTFSAKFGQRVNIILGKNGSGKTNILEAISYLSPGRGLRSMRFEDVIKHGEKMWHTVFQLKSKLGIAEIISTYTQNDRSRKILYNGAKMSGGELCNLLDIIWLIPQMEGIFLGPASDRRKFIDRIVYSFSASYAAHLAKYNYYMKERNLFLANEKINSQDRWLTTLEKHMAEAAFQIATAREEVLNLMQDAIDSLETDFPKAKLSITSLFESEEQWDNFELNYIQILQNNRQKDSYSGRTNFGVHKSDLIVLHQGKQHLAKLCSTGEQKALLISIIIASIEAILQHTQTSLILLLDELFVHLDDIRKKALALYIQQRKMQTFITATDLNGIEDLAIDAHIIKL